jgi:hypothetical protein
VKKETINKPKPSTARSPNLTIAKQEIIKPIAVLLTPKDAAKIGIAGIIKPKPIATKNETVESIATSLGSCANGFLLTLFNAL